MPVEQLNYGCAMVTIVHEQRPWNGDGRRDSERTLYSIRITRPDDPDGVKLRWSYEHVGTTRSLVEQVQSYQIAAIAHLENWLDANPTKTLWWRATYGIQKADNK